MNRHDGKMNPQVGPSGNATGESHTATAVSPLRNLGGDTQLPSSAPTARPAALAPKSQAATPAPKSQAATSAPKSQAATSAPKSQAATTAPKNTNPAATHAPHDKTLPDMTIISGASAGGWKQSLVRNSVTNNPDNDTDDASLESLREELRALRNQREKIIARMKEADSTLKGAGQDESSGGSDATLAGEVRWLQQKRGKLLAREREVGDRMRKIREGERQRDARKAAGEEVRDQPQVREGHAQRETRPDAETEGKVPVREGETQRETYPPAPQPTRADDGNRPTDTNRTRPKKRGKRAGTVRRTFPETATRPHVLEPQPGPSGLATAKRVRPDDTASPGMLQGEPKRVRVQPALGEQRSYALATTDIPARLAVAICPSPPTRDLTPEETKIIRTSLERLVFDADPNEPLPAFRGLPRAVEGTVRVWCETDHALTWLTENVPRIEIPDTDITLTVMRQSEVPTRVKAHLFVPGYRGPIAKLQSVLRRQNTWYDVGKWSLYRAISIGGDKQGTFLTLGIPPEEAEKILGRERRVSYLLGSIYIRFPPKVEPQDAQAQTDTDETRPTDKADDDEMRRLEEVMARTAMAETETTPPASPGWSEQLLASSPHEGRHERMEGDEPFDDYEGFVSS